MVAGWYRVNFRYHHLGHVPVNDRKTISKRTVDAHRIPKLGETRLWDDKLAGFCIRAYAATSRIPAGRRVYAVKYRVNRRQGWFTIGEHGKPWRDSNGVDHPSLTPDMARDEAGRVLAQAKAGDDPQARKRERRDSKTVGDLIDDYLIEGPLTKNTKRASSWATDRSNLERHVRPLIGRKNLSEIGANDIGRMLRGVTDGETAVVEKTMARGKAIVRGGAGVAHRVLSTTKAMFAWAIDQKLYRITANPCAGRRLPKRPSSERFLSNEEAVALFGVLQRLEDEAAIRPIQAAIFRLLLLTGCRRNEIAGLRWSEVDLERRMIILPPSRSKTGELVGERHIALNNLAVAILNGLPREAKARFVFPASKGKSGHTTTAPKVWRTKVRPAAQLLGLRIHDLRHSFASFALADGASLPMVGKALGHRNARSTERYSHLTLDPLRALSEKVADRLGAKP